jgi:hypothetical protein
MPPASRRPRSRQPELFPRSKRPTIEIAPNHRLVQITEEVDWTELEELVQAIRLSKLKNAAGRPPHLRALIGALMLRAMRYRPLRDMEDLIRYYAPARYLCGLTETDWTPDFNTISDFEQLMGEEGVKLINEHVVKWAVEEKPLDTDPWALFTSGVSPHAVLDRDRPRAVAAVLAGCGGQHVASWPTVSLSVFPPSTCNRGRPLQALVRAVTLQQFVQDQYSNVARLVVGRMTRCCRASWCSPASTRGSPSPRRPKAASPSTSCSPAPPALLEAAVRPRVIDPPPRSRRQPDPAAVACLGVRRQALTARGQGWTRHLLVRGASSTGMLKPVAAINLADPAFEPTDEQLGELFKRAFADVESKHRESLARLRAEIARLRVEARRRVAGVSR